MRKSQITHQNSADIYLSIYLLFVCLFIFPLRKIIIQQLFDAQGPYIYFSLL